MAEQNGSLPVFISYARADVSLARKLSRTIAEAGLRPWLDLDEIRGNDQWEERLEQALRDARILVVLLTPASAQSPSIFFEVGAAVADHKTIIPVLSEDMEAADMPAFLREFHWVRASKDPEDGALIARAIKSAAAGISGPVSH
jgi:hypothetical protein